MTSVSIIIPVKEVNDYAREAIRKVHSLFPDHEVLLIPDRDSGEELPGALVIASAPITTPGEKRDFGAQFATGEILAFLDDDAYPTEGWLDSAMKHFYEADVIAVGGPGITPPSDTARQRASGWALASFLGSGNSTYRFRSGKRKDVDDFPSMNFLIRKLDFLSVGGFSSPYWPGEDTELCRKLIATTGKRIVYEPEAVVYHHRRPVFLGHLRQQARYGLHRGYFSRRFSGNSRRLSYAMPALFTVGLVAGFCVSLLSGPALTLYIAVLSVYFAALVGTGCWIFWHERNGWVAVLAMAAIFATHIAYGLAYIKGLFTPELSH